MNKPQRLSAEAALAAVVERVSTAWPIWIGVDGLGGAGKTTWADQLAQRLGGAVVIGVDDFARPVIRGWDRERFLRQVVAPLRQGATAYYQLWDVASDLPRGWAEVPPRRPVIVEGVSATDLRLGIEWTVTVWLDAPLQVRRRRIADRDQGRWTQRWLNDWIPSEEAYLASQRPPDRVDLIVEVPGEDHR